MAGYCKHSNEPSRPHGETEEFLDKLWERMLLNKDVAHGVVELLNV
jgi:hypothetical protein